MNELNSKIDNGFDNVDNEFHELRLEMEELNSKVDKGFDGLLSLQHTNDKVSSFEKIATNHETRIENLETSIHTMRSKNK